MDHTFEEWDRKAAEAIDEAESELKDLWGGVRATAKGEPPPDSWLSMYGANVGHSP